MIAPFLRFPNYTASDHYNSHTQRFYNTPPTQPLKINPFKMLCSALFDRTAIKPSQHLPQMQPDWDYFHRPTHKAKIIWFGHSSLLLQINGLTLLIDPVFAPSVSPLRFSMRRFQPAIVTAQSLPKIDYILYSHSHYDHLDKTVIDYFKTTQTQFIVPLGIEIILQNWGVSASKIQTMDWWQSIEMQDLTITATPARHNTARGIFDRDKTLWCGYVFDNHHERIYFSGDSAYGDGRYFKQIGTYFGGIDLALMENGQYHHFWADNHMFPTQTIQAVQDVQAEYFMPIHWGAYALSMHAWYEPVQQSIALAEQQHIKTLTPMMGQVVEIGQSTSSWWLEYI